jgi:glycerophosphoryl diester phosphodiesterase
MKVLTTAVAACAAALLQAPLLLAVPAAATAAPLVERPIVIAHRGASGYLPEETMASYRLALQMGADFIEPDLFLTADGVLVARHDRNLNTTTNVQTVALTDPELMAKRASNGAFNVDQLTYADIQKLSARSRGTPTNGYAMPGNGYYEATDTFPVATLREVLDYAYEVYVATGRVVGVYPEVKTITGTGAAEYHRRMAEAIVAMLADPKYNGYFDGSLDNVYLQSFDGAVVEYMNSITHLPVAFLTACPATPEAAQAIKAIADGVGFSHTSSAASAACVERAHAAGLLVHVYTLLNDPVAHAKVHSWGVDGVFGNHPDVAKSVRDAHYPLTAVGFGAPVGAATVVQDPGQAEPLAGAGTPWHRVRAGSAIPLKFEVFSEASGAELVTFMGAVDRVRVFTVPGCAGAVGAELPYVSLATEDGGLRYEAAAGHFALTWKTPRTSGEACYRVTFTTRDGSALHAYVRTTR